LVYGSRGTTSGSAGTVYAVDINREYLKYIDVRAKREALTNIRTILGKDDDPLLPAQTIVRPQ